MAVGLKKINRLLPIPGVQVSACSAHIYKTNRKDLALISFPEDANCAAVFTQNMFCAAPVILAKKHLSQGSPRYCLINSGNANAGLGDRGLKAATDVCQYLAEYAQANIENVLPFSTGVIAEPLPVNKIKEAIPDLYNDLAEDSWNDVADAILTTDTMAKGVSKKLQLPGGDITITGIAKGSGMIRPDMATMLAFIATDANISVPFIEDLLTTVVRASFNCINVDGDTSTNDACFMVATGKADSIEIKSLQDGIGLSFFNTLMEICIHLAQAIVRDGEGATKFISVVVVDGQSQEECKKLALTVANSPLVKTAFFAGDPNLGRILAAVGRAPLTDLDINRVAIALNGLKVFESGEKVPDYKEADAANIMKQEELVIHISLGRGHERAVIWTSDLSHEYVRINSEYRS